MTTTLATPAQPRTSSSIDPRLCIMMFLHYCVWGIWMPILPMYLAASPSRGGLGFTEGEQAAILAVAGSIGALASPFVGGQFADRYFSTEKYLGITMLIGGAINWLLAYQTSYLAWLVLSTIYAVVYMPTLGLTNSLALYHLSEPKRQFSLVRVWGTIAWIAVSWAFPMLWLQTDLHLRWMPPFLVGTDLPDATHRVSHGLIASAILSVIYGLFCFMLPHTPPKKDAVEPLAFAKTFRLMRMKSLAVLTVAGLLFAAVHKIYFLQTSKFFESIGVAKANVGAAMSVGQFSEILCMVLLGVMITRLGLKAVLVIGAAAYVARFTVFSIPGLPVWFYVASQFLHGICFACAWVGAFIYIDRISPADVRHSMQSVFNMVTVGAGFILGGLISGLALGPMFKQGDSLNFTGFWLATAGVAVIPVALLLIGFRDESATITADQP